MPWPLPSSFSGLSAPPLGPSQSYKKRATETQDLGWLNGHTTDVLSLCLHSPSWCVSRTARRARCWQRWPRRGPRRAWAPWRSWPSRCCWRSGDPRHLRHLRLPRSRDGRGRGKIRFQELLKHNFRKRVRKRCRLKQPAVPGPRGEQQCPGINGRRPPCRPARPAPPVLSGSDRTLGPREHPSSSCCQSVLSLRVFTMVHSAVTSYLRPRPM